MLSVIDFLYVAWLLGGASSLLLTDILSLDARHHFNKSPNYSTFATPCLLDIRLYFTFLRSCISALWGKEEVDSIGLLISKHYFLLQISLCCFMFWITYLMRIDNFIGSMT